MFKKRYSPKSLRDKMNNHEYATLISKPKLQNTFLWINDTVFRILNLTYEEQHSLEAADHTEEKTNFRPFKAVVQPEQGKNVILLLKFMLASEDYIFSGKIEQYHKDGITKKSEDVLLRKAYLSCLSYLNVSKYSEGQKDITIIIGITPVKK